MAQAAFTFDTAAPATGAGTVRQATAPTGRSDCPGGRDGTAFEIGWDFAHHRLTPPVSHLHADNPVRQGWSAGRAVFGNRTLRPTRGTRQWLGLRLQAWQQGWAFESVQVTPHLLARIEVPLCPVARVVLTDGLGGDSDGVIERMNPAAAVAAGNLAMVSAGVHRAKGRHDWSSAWARAAQIEGGDGAPVDGLDAAAWRRLAVLMSFATPIGHAQAAGLPLLALPPNRLRLLNPIQALQAMLTMQFCRAGYARRLVALAALMPSSDTRQAFQIFMHTLLARRLAAGPVLDEHAARHAMECAWADTLVQRRWQRLAERLDAQACERLLQRAAARGLSGSGSRWLSDEAATEGWALESAGQVPLAAVEGVVSANPVSH